jgi:CDP-6-deoxy-D-xylo-4-hexulose-3-dehydrase
MDARINPRIKSGDAHDGGETNLVGKRFEGPDMRIPLNTSTIGEAEKEAVKAVLESGQLTMGERCRAFEREFASYLGVEHAVMVNSGSSANLIALFAMASPLHPSDGTLPRRLAPGSEVIVPALTWSTTLWPVLQAGAKPVLVDCDPGTLQMTPAAIAAAVTSATSAIVVVHVLGGAVDAAAVASIARSKGLWLFEDTCESLGVAWDGRKVGTFGQLASFSFYFSHHITTIEGGMVVTNDARLADLLRSLRAHGWVRDMHACAEIAAGYPHIDPRFLFVTAGFNVRPTEINAAIGLEQLARLHAFNESRRQVARRLDAGLAPVARAGHLALIRHDPRVTPAPFGYTVLCGSQAARDGLRDHLEAAGVETRPVICGNLARQPGLAHYDYRISGALAGADRIMDCGLYWGAHPNMREDEVDYVVATVREYFQMTRTTAQA